ncbi:MAG: gamma carbonic anhydrase family protein [Chloroflexi bacterium]|nr:gamma carbonic anhydrase family protein [Chloroflexota bacterium]
MDTQHHPDYIDPSVFVAAGAVITGDVYLGAQSSVWFNAVIRADTDRVVIGERTNVQDGVIIHVDAGKPCTIGNGVTIGHRAVVHGALVEDDVLIGIGAIVLSGAKIGHESILGAGTLVTGGTVVPPRSLVLGVPGRVVRSLSDEEVASIKNGAARYVQYSAQYRCE